MGLEISSFTVAQALERPQRGQKTAIEFLLLLLPILINRLLYVLIQSLVFSIMGIKIKK